MYGVARPLYFIAALVSILLSVWAACKTTVINPDAICYLSSAAAMEQGLSFAAHLCDQAKWPFYSMLIFGLAKLTHLSFTTAAFTLDGFFSLLSVLAFIAIVGQLTSNRRILAFAALVILVAHHFNGLRVEILRDHGFWAFYLLSIFCILRGRASFWSLSLIIATLFRIEGAVFLLLLPIVLLFDFRQPISARLKTFLRLNVLTILAIIGGLLWLITHPDQSIGRLAEVQLQLTSGVMLLVHAFQHTSYALQHYVLSVYAASDASWIALGMLMVWYIGSVIANVSWLYAALIVYAWWKNIPALSHEKKWLLGAYIAVNVLITFVFLLDNLFLATRYLIALSLVLMLWVPFALNDLLLQWRTRKWPVIIIAILLLISAAGGIFSWGHSKKYIREGGDWLAIHAPQQAKIYSNDFQLLYYANHLGNAIFTVGHQYQNLNTIAHGKWREYDYLALRVGKDTQAFREINWAPAVIFRNDRGDEVRIYKVGEKE